jgi:uncharacterized alpha/beta hydrolase family protein
LLTNLIANGNLVLEAIKPTLMITGSGGANTTANTITFNFRMRSSAISYQ